MGLGDSPTYPLRIALEEIHLANYEDNRIIASSLTYAYPDADRNAVENVTMRVKKGEFLAVLGHNGSGKSTLAKLFNALYVPTNGTVWVCGLDTKDDDLVFDIRQHAGMVFQNPDNQIVATVVEEDVAFGLENNGVEPKEIRVRIDEALAAVNMSKYAKKAPHMLSGGQKQRVAIAGVLAMKPDVIILDESTAMLDPSGRAEVMNTVHRLNREEGISVVIITHYMGEAATADYVIVMDEGKIAMSGTPREVFTKVDAVRKLGLDVPPMTDLAHMLRAKGLDVRADVLTVDEMVEEVCRLSSNI
ncbi:MAG: energy-coupling factor transporter ATPase [Clostridia bacterium]|nr:energy-coupling factor transporter ATPase [Clostridia bacterium]